MTDLTLRPELDLVAEAANPQLHDPPAGLELSLVAWQHELVQQLLDGQPLSRLLEEFPARLPEQGELEIEHFVRCLILLNLVVGAGDEPRLKIIVARASGSGHVKRAPMAFLPDTLPPCGGCPSCCRPELRGFLTAEEAGRIKAHPPFAELAQAAGVAMLQKVAREGGGQGEALGRRPDGLCLYWDQEVGCRVGAELGRDAMPAQCRAQPLEAVLSAEGVIVSDGGGGPCGKVPTPAPPPAEWLTPPIGAALRQLAEREGLHRPAMVLPGGLVSSITHLESLTLTALGLLELEREPEEPPNLAADLAAICRLVFLYADQLSGIPLEADAGEECRRQLKFWDPANLHDPEVLPADPELFLEALKQAVTPFLARAHLLCGIAYQDPAGLRAEELETCCQLLLDVKQKPLVILTGQAWDDDDLDAPLRYHLRQRLHGRALAAGGQVGPALGALVLHFLVVLAGTRRRAQTAGRAQPRPGDVRGSMRLARRALDTVVDREVLEAAGPALELVARHFAP